jgi:hypothetical protein
VPPIALYSVICSASLVCYMIGKEKWMLKTNNFTYVFLINDSFLKLIPLGQGIDRFVSLPFSLFCNSRIQYAPSGFCHFDTKI